MKILIIEDDASTAQAVSFLIGQRWPFAEVLLAESGVQGVERVGEDGPDAVILDVGLPDISGIEVLRQIRLFSDVPILVLTALNSEIDIARFLEEGADDYMTKPFGNTELLARIQAVIRRGTGRLGTASLPLQTDDLIMDFSAAVVSRAGELILLTRTEMKMLEVLVRNAPRVVTFGALASMIQGVVEPSDTESNVIRVHVQHLRSKLGDTPQNPKYIANVRGVGYKFLLHPSPIVASEA